MKPSYISRNTNEPNENHKKHSLAEFKSWLWPNNVRTFRIFGRTDPEILCNYVYIWILCQFVAFAACWHFRQRTRKNISEVAPFTERRVIAS